MIKQILSLYVFACTAVLVLSGPPLAAQDKDFCKESAAGVLNDPNPIDILDHNVINFVNNPSCLFQVSLSDPKVNEAIAPARVSLSDAYQSFSAGQQQGSNLSSSGSTNAVSKTSGPTSLVEEFGGANVTRGTSSTTAQWSPGTMLTNLALTGVDYLCLTTSQATGKKEPDPCISAGLLRGLTPLTFKITANTSSGTPSTTGMAASSGSASSAQPVTVNSKGASGPSFAGLTVQYSLYGSRGKAAVKSLTNQVTSAPSSGKGGTASQPALKYYRQELLALDTLGRDLTNCKAYADWTKTATVALKAMLNASAKAESNADVTAFQGGIESQYKSLLSKMLSDPSCKTALYDSKGLYAAILEAETYEYFNTAVSSSAKPELALEYDLNTPQSKPSYSSAKITANWQFGKGTPDANRLEDFANAQTATLAATGANGAKDTSSQLGTKSKSLAQTSAPPWSFTVTGTADIYNSEPPSSIPSASHLRDIQAGAELAYVFSPFGKNSVLGSFLGSATAAAAYSYEDQTSPAILTGPALSDFTGLPSSTTTAYAKRGVIHLGQVRLGFGTGKNITYPLAFTYSNRTELITHPTWGLQFGISYNLTSLFNSSGTTKSGNGN
jgi:hypothetical protein